MHGESLTVQSRRDCIDFCANEVFLSRDENGGRGWESASQRRQYESEPLREGGRHEERTKEEQVNKHFP